MKKRNHFHCATIGGNFNSFHKGHKEYIDIAFNTANFVYIYVMSDCMAKKRKNYPIKPYDQRCQKIVEYLRENNWLHRTKFCEIFSGHVLENNIVNQNFDLAVVEPAYFNLFNLFNKKRSEIGKKKFCIIYKPRTIDMKGNDISSTIIESENLLKLATKTRV